MRFNHLKATLKTAVLTVTVLLLGVGLCSAQVNLTAGPTNLTMPDGSTLPMWGYTCGKGSTGPATCAALNPKGTGWSPVVITVPTGQTLQINLTNSLSFTPNGSTTANNIPTSLVIVGQLGGGLGNSATTTASPTHAAQGTTWPIAGPPDTSGGNTTDPTNGAPTFNPPPQQPRVQSFATEVGAGASAVLTWTTPRPGTYLIESGTHPSIQGPMGLYGILVVTSAPTADGTGKETAPGTAYTGVTYDAELPLLFSEIDPVQNKAVSTAVNTAGFSENTVWSGQPGGCGNPSSSTYQACYPPAVNYTPLYYLINGVAFDKTNVATSLFSAVPGTLAPATGTGTVLVRMVNAGSRMHVPSIVGAQTGLANPAASGFSLIAEDGNPLPGVPRVQSEVFMAAGKTYDVMINAPATVGPALPIFDRELSLSGNAIGRDAGMLAYIGINGATVPAGLGGGAPVARADTYNSVLAGQALTISDPSKGLIANDTNVYGVQLLAAPAGGKVTLNSDGTFQYVPNSGTTSDSFTYCANGSVTGSTCSSGVTASVTLGAAPIEGAGGITCNVPSPTYTSNVATALSIKPPGVLSFCKDSAGYKLTVASATATGCTASVDPNGGFNATGATGTCTINFTPQNSQGTSGSPATATLMFPTATGLKVSVVDGVNQSIAITDYRWIIEEDRTFYVDPNCTTNPPTGNCPSSVLNFGTNFHTSYMPVVATGCTGQLSCETSQTVLGKATACDIGNGVCRMDGSATQETPLDPGQVALDPTKRYYISVLPGDAANPFLGANGSAPTNCVVGPGTPASPNTDCGHGMGGAPIAAGQKAVTVLSEPTPLQPAKLSVFVFEDDFPLNGEQDGGGGIDVLSPNEPGLGSFQITLFDDAGGTGDATGQPTYDMFNMPLSNSLAGTIDPQSGQDACPISHLGSQGGDGTPSPLGITGMIVTCPKYESDGTTLSPLAGQAVVANLYPGRYGVVATPAADRIARGEEWLQTNTLDGQHAHDSFLRVGEPGYFQEFGPAGFHVSIGFANPKIINDRGAALCASLGNGGCTHTVSGQVTNVHMSRTPDERLYSSGSRDAFSFTQCYVSLGYPDDEDFAFTKCDADGNFKLTNIPTGQWKIAIFDQWNDQIVDGIATPVDTTNGDVDMKQIAVNQWQANIYTRTFFDQNGDGVSNIDGSGNPTEPGLALVPTNIRFRDGSYSNFNSTDLNGYAGFNEVFPLFAWYVIETDSTRYKTTGIHVVYDAGGPTDGSSVCGQTGLPPCGTSTIGQFFANTVEPAAVALPTPLRVPGSVYCDNADCSGFSIASGPIANGSSGPGGSTGRIDPPWVNSYGWQGFAGQNSFLEFGKKPYAPGENGGIHGHVVYASTRPFDDPQLLLQLSWEPLVPHVTVNLYQEGTAPDGSTSLKLVDTTQTSSFDDWAQGFRSDGVPNMNCPGQATDDPFFFGLQNQPSYLDWYNSQHGGPAAKALPNNSQFKCYDGMHNWNQLQPAPYDGMYQFPSVTGMDAKTGKPTGTNCSICVTDPDASDPFRYGGSTTPGAWTTGNGAPMLPAGKYVVEVVVPPGYELVKEEDKNILIGDNYIAPVTQQFAGLGNIFILPDQAEVASLYNGNNAQNATQNLGRIQPLPSHEGDTGSVETFWPCVGQARTVPDYISLFPGSAEVAPFAGATRNLCDRKEITLTDQTSALAKFYVFTSTHVASHFTGIITDDLTSEFDPFSPQFGEKFAPAYLPVSLKDFNGNEINRVYSDAWGTYNGLNYSTWEVNPPNPTGYAPTMMVTCMNDAGNGATPDPLFQQGYSQFCYELPFMPGQTGYFDTPVVSVSAFSEGYNHPDCSYPDATPAIASVTSQDIQGPWVSAAGHTITINALGDQFVENYAYTGPSQNTAPYNQQKVKRHYGFGNTAGTVTIGGVAATVASNGWTDGQITAVVPTGVPNCAIQQQGQSSTQCGQLVINAANGKSSIDAITVTIGGKMPTVMTAGQTIQSAIDAAQPGDMIIVPPGRYMEMVLIWKPVRLQGVGAASAIIDAKTQPAGKMDPWRRQVNCLFGLALNGTPITSGTNGNPYDPSGTFSCTSDMQFSVDRLPLEATVGWDATLNGNLAEQLQEPTLMGAYEGAAITVLSKGVKFPKGSNPFASDVFPTGTELLTASDCSVGGTNPYPGNFWCNPASIDGLGITDSSEGGGGIFVHGWGHNIQIANNRVYGNTGTLSGGITVGQGEHPDGYLVGGVANTVPGSCQTGRGLPTNAQLPYCFDMNVNVHNNVVTHNSSIGDELFSSTPAGSGGVSFCNGSDFYNFNYNWVCGNLSSGDGAGVAHIGFSYNGNITHNTILFNQSINPTIPTNGGGLLVMGAPDLDPLCAVTNDKDCVPTPGTVPPSDGTGPGLTIDSNLILGNAAESGSGGGVRLQHVNGAEVINLPTQSRLWNSVKVQNNIIANNVAGWDGAGVSLQDALNVDMINNTIISNDSTASSGVLFNSLFAPLSSSPDNTSCQTQGTDPSKSCSQIAGVASTPNSANLMLNLTPVNVNCPPGHSSAPGVNDCKKASFPRLYNNVIWENRSFFIGVGSLGTGMQNQQTVVALYNSTTNTAAANQPLADATTGNGGGSIITGGTGACTIPGSANAASYWDIGVRGDTGPTDHSSGFTLTPTYSVLTSTTGYSASGLHNTQSDPTVATQYCNGSRIPPELGSGGYLLPPGTNETNAPVPLFNLQPNATVDEGNNWINMRWGPLSLTHPVTGALLSNYSPTSTSSSLNYIPSTAGGTNGAYTLAPSVDFFGNPRKTNNAVDAGAIEFQGASTRPTLASIAPTSGFRGNVVAVTLTGNNLTGTTAVSVSGTGVAVSGVTAVNATTVTATFTIATNATLSTRAVSVTAQGLTSNTVNFTVQNPPAPTVTAVSPTSGVRGSNVPVTITGTNFTTAGTTVAVNGGGVGVTGVTVVSSTQITATFNITNGATLGARNVRVTNTSGITSATNPGDTFRVLGGTVAISAPSPLLTTSPANTSTKSGTITVSNTAAGANAGPLTLTAAPTITRLTGTGAFSITGGSCASGVVVNPGGNCTITVQYVPNGTATSTAGVTITDTGAASTSQNSASFSGN